MSLDSTETLTNAQEGAFNNEVKTDFTSKRRTLPQCQELEVWCYLFVHHKKIDTVRAKLEAHFQTFVHRNVVYKRENKLIKKEERPTVAGLLFVRGKVQEIQAFFSENFFGLHLIKDCSTKDIAIIPDRVMQSFMKISEVNPTRIRFMPHSFGHYSTGNTLVRLTSGPLVGFEGYRIRIARDKCLVTSLGGMTIAIGGIHKDSFENIDEYVRQRRIRLQERVRFPKVALTPSQSKIEACFFMPQNQLDILIIAEKLNHWIIMAKSLKTDKDFEGAVEIALFILKEIGSHYQSIYGNTRIGDFTELDIVCHSADYVLKSILESEDVSVDLKEIVETEKQFLVTCFPFLPIVI